jgi:YHS domain-containing protein
MIRFLTFGLLASFLYIALKKVFCHERNVTSKDKLQGELMVKDPECGVYIPISQATVMEWEGEKFYFCSNECAIHHKGRNKK